MALFKPLLGDESRISLEVTPFHEGYVYFVKEGFLYFDVNLGTEETPNNQRIKLKADAEIAQKLIELNKLSEMAFWIGTKEEYEVIETKEDNVLYIVTDDFQDVTFEDKSNKVAVLDETCTDEQYPSALAIYNFVQSCIEEYIASTPTITSSTSEPTSEDGKVGDIWVVI